MQHRAVIFDIGGVIVDSPMEGIARYERDRELPRGFINRLIVDRGDEGAWARLEQGKGGLDEFYAAFEKECREAGAEVSARDLMQAMGNGMEPREIMLEAVKRIRAHGLATAALTNNWKVEGAENALAAHFDHFVESSVVGLSKPDPRIYEYACEQIGIEPSEAVFLDDIGRNLKTARALGMATIKVTAPETALSELERLLGFSLGD